MPLIAAAAIFVGAVEVSTVVAGLTYASAALYVAGKATGNDTLMKLSTVTGLAAAGTGLYEGLSAAAGDAVGGTSAGGLAEGGSAATDANGIAAGISPGQLPVEGLGLEGATGDAATGAISFGGAPEAADAASQAGSAASLSSELEGTPNAGSLANPTGSGGASYPTGISQASTTGPASIGGTDPTANNLAGNTTAAQAPTGIINQNMPSNATGMDLSLDPKTDAQVASFNPGAQDAGALQMPAVKDPSLLQSAKNFWSGLSPTEKLMAGQFISKGLGSIDEFVGPKAELMKAQAGLSSAQTGLINQQTANINQKASKIPTMTYTFTPPGH